MTTSQIVICAGVFLMVAAIWLWDVMGRDRPIPKSGFTEVRVFGEVRNFEVRTVTEDATGRAMVCLYRTVHMGRSGSGKVPWVRAHALSSAEAQQLARLLRIAAAPGKTLAEALHNHPPAADFAKIRN